jgi:hypothetical protein
MERRKQISIKHFLEGKTVILYERTALNIRYRVSNFWERPVKKMKKRKKVSILHNETMLEHINL